MEQNLLGKRTFDLQSDKLFLKEAMKKSFLFIELWAVSDDNPNNNYTHFIAEDYNNSLQSFIDKPILGYFTKEDGDFKAHEGKIEKDDSNGIMFWDNFGGEKILGFIRDKDKIEVRQKDGKNWIVVNAALWTQYNYREIKKIIKDKHKKISVEIEVQDSYFTDLEQNLLDARELKNDHTLICKNEEGQDVKYKYGSYIEHISKFELSGITILGSRYGTPIKEGIEGASLSLLSEDGRAIFSRQQQALAFAYQELDGETGVVANNISKEDNGEMDNPSLNVENTEPNVANETPEQQAEKQNFEQVCPNCGSADCDGSCENNAANEQCENQHENQEQNPEPENQPENQPENECGHFEEGKGEENQEPANSDDQPKPENECGHFAEGEKDGEDEGEEDNDDGSDEDEDDEKYVALMQKFEETSKALEECQQALATQTQKYEEISTLNGELNAKFEAQTNEVNELKNSISTLEKANFELTVEKRTNEAKEMMSKIEIVEEKRNEILDNCQKGLYNASYDSLKKDIAVLFFDSNCVKTSTANSNFSIPVVSNVNTEKTSVTKKSAAEKLREYNNR